MNIVDCGHDADSQKSAHTTGYGVGPDGKRICFSCCASADIGRMLKDGNSRRLPLYLSTRVVAPARPGYGELRRYVISNWPGTLWFETGCVKHGKHNMARTQTRVWFMAPDGYWWTGVQYGDNTQIVYCRRTRQRVRAGAA